MTSTQTKSKAETMYGNASASDDTRSDSSSRSLSSLDLIYAFMSGLVLGMIAACVFALAFLVTTTIGLDHE